MATILAVSNRKGGTGKTTTAVNLAAEWGARGFRTLLVDLDPQGHAGLGFDVIARAGDPAAHHLFTRPGFRLAEAIRPSRFANVFVAPADRTFDGAAIERSPCALRRELIDGECAEAFDRIIIDTPPSLDMLLVNALAAADCLLAPLIPHSLSAEGVQQLTRLVRKLATSVNPKSGSNRHASGDGEQPGKPPARHLAKTQRALWLRTPPQGNSFGHSAGGSLRRSCARS